MLVLAALPARALDPSRAITQYRLQSWSTKEGLPQSSVEALLQTRDGYLWLGTQEGLVRFDGIRFVVFDKSNTKALKANRVVALCEDRKGDLWIGTEGGGLTRLQQGVFTTWREANGLPNDRVRAVVEDASGVLWVGTDRGLARARGSEFTTVALPGRFVGSLHAAKDGTVWVGARDGSLRPMRQDQLGEPIPIPGSGAVQALWQDEDGTLWVGRRDALVRVGPGSVRAYTAREGLPGRSVMAIRRDRDGSLWVGTENGGLARLRGDRFEVFTTREGLSNNIVQEILEDREGNLWVGTQDGGLNRLADGKFVTWTEREGLAADIVWPVMGDREGNLWAGTSNGGLSRFRDGVFTNFTTRDGLSSNSIQALAQDAEGALWVGTRGGGLDRLKNGRWTRWTTRDGLPSDSVNALLPDREGRLWIGLRDGGLVWMDRGRIVPVGGQSLLREVVHFLHQDRRGDVWIATNGRGPRALFGGRLQLVHHQGGTLFGHRERRPRGCGRHALGGDVRGRPEPAARRLDRQLDHRRGPVRRRDLPDPRGRTREPLDELQQGGVPRGQAGAGRGGAGRAALPPARGLRAARRHAQPAVQRGEPAPRLARCRMAGSSSPPSKGW